ncbi:hypothetical protein TSTA_088970 [Talaromyces stipitatus ATCC 10500]|uniref:Uncharacterized protein n=1 Tax=Talaromyces stipitatus (strain ATCC 10500 / CBS 375.48 / QM 6759 / NRRL 1006) TaxID=441959 RepID=B8LZA8_TALSN|nr:uncharacterized protein TSTA_088970 [Talaromyces stipitatus ATCC 10500]EED21661.1 hypothetical protein TSTA_088970 [Talaromyces stipitatus ATCC 10500]
MAPAKDSVKKRITWTEELTQKMFISIINTLEPSQINYAKVAEQLGEGHTRDTVYKRIYDLEKRYSNQGDGSTHIGCVILKAKHSHLTEEVKTKTNEELEEQVFNLRAKLFKFDRESHE